MRQVVLFLILSSLVALKVNAQEQFWLKSDSLNRKRACISAGSVALAWSGSMIGLHSVWYKNVEKNGFHTFNDCGNWLQMDKAGHIYTANKLSELTGNLFEWSGIQKKNATLLGSAVGLGFQTTLELLDGYSSDWGFSWCDFGANVLGTGIYATQNLTWGEQRILLKFSYHPTEYAALRPEVLGNNFQERLLKDYNGQTYWLSFSPGAFLSDTKIPQWLCVSLGYSVDQKLVGDQESYFSMIENKEYNAQRQFIFSFDIDFSKLPIKKLWLKTLVSQFNYLKIPFPALIISGNEWRGAPLYF